MGALQSREIKATQITCRRSNCTPEVDETRRQKLQPMRVGHLISQGAAKLSCG